MKHLLNNLSNEEKNNIRKQHTGGMNIMTENFNRLMGGKHGNVKPLVEQVDNTRYNTAYASNIGNYPNCVRALGRPTKITPNPTTWFDHAIMGNGTTKGFIFYPYMVGQDGKSLMVPNSLKVNKPGTTGEDGRVVYACKGNDILIEGKLYSSKCPVGKGTSEEIKEFQDWLDSNVKGWVASQPDGVKKDVTKGYGKCGPSTRKAWAKHKDDFKLQKSVKFVPPSVEPGEGDDVVIPDEVAVAVNENFRRLMGAKHGNAKPLINEQEDEDDIDAPREYHGDNSLSGKYKGYLKNGGKDEVDELLSNLPTDTQFLALIDCEYADFSDIDLDNYNDLVFINLDNTPNNLLKTNSHSFRHDGGSFYITKNM